MPRRARLVLPGNAHHVTQRGNNKENVFLDDEDRRHYLALLGTHSKLAGMDIAGFCLMSNHVHLVVIPHDAESMALALRRAHGEFAQQHNRRANRSGHLWQNRFYSCVLDDRGCWVALQYVERNPVRAGLVAKAGDWEWSSARDHLGLRSRQLLGLRIDEWRQAYTTDEWRTVLEGDPQAERVEALRRDTRNGWAADNPQLQRAIELVMKRQARPRQSSQLRTTAGRPDQ